MLGFPVGDSDDWNGALSIVTKDWYSVNASAQHRINIRRGPTLAGKLENSSSILWRPRESLVESVCVILGAIIVRNLGSFIGIVVVGVDLVPSSMVWHGNSRRCRATMPKSKAVEVLGWELRRAVFPSQEDVWLRQGRHKITIYFTLICSCYVLRCGGGE